MRTIKLTLAYDGTDYVGWQRQARGRSIQGEVERVLAEIEGRPVTVVGAGRTDAGVHALGQAASVQLAHDIPTPALGRALNAKLPPDIRVLRAETAADDFHARFGARRKTYRYRLSTAAVASPFTRRYVWSVRAPLDIEAMRAAAAALCGRRDFAAFCATGSEVASTVRTLHVVTVAVTEAAPLAPAPPPGGAAPGTLPPPAAPSITIEVVGDGFLRHMVRILVGTLVAVGAGRVPAGEVGAIVRSRARERAGPTAPPHGLFLVAVDY